MYIIVSYRKAGRNRYWTGRSWTRALCHAGRYAVRSEQFVRALARAQESRRGGIVGLLRQGA